MRWLEGATFEAKVKYHQLRRHVRWLRERGRFARVRVEEDSLRDYPVEAFAHSSTLIRDPDHAERDLQYGKIANLEIACRNLDRLLIQPDEVFSFWYTVSPPTRRRGFQNGLELRRKQLVPSVGGGLCQLSNLLYWMALNLDLEITEHHRHAYDLFPDHERRLPFASGATVLYNYRDLQFCNRLGQPLVLRVRVGPEHLEGRLLAPRPLDLQAHIYETDHSFFAKDGAVWRTNRLWRRLVDGSGEVLREELVSHNVCEVLYDVPSELVERRHPPDDARPTTS